MSRESRLRTSGSLGPLAVFGNGELAAAKAAIHHQLRRLRSALRRDPGGSGDTAILWLTALPAALREVDDPEGSLARQLHRGLVELLPSLLEIAGAAELGAAWADRLWPALGADGRGHLDPLADAWGELVADDAGAWADRLLPEVTAAWARGEESAAGRACLSVLLAAGRHRELLRLLEGRPLAIWPERVFGVRALAALGEVDRALAYARDSNPLGHPYEVAIAAICEAILVAAGRREEAYRGFARLAHRRQNCLQTFRSLEAAYPERAPAAILGDLIADDVGNEGRWFATARSLRFYNLAAEIAARAPCDPRTLNRAAGEGLVHDPSFTLEVALASLRWIASEHGHVIDGADVIAAYDLARAAAARLGRAAAERLGAELRGITQGPEPYAEWVHRLLAPLVAEGVGEPELE